MMDDERPVGDADAPWPPPFDLTVDTTHQVVQQEAPKKKRKVMEMYSSLSPLLGQYVIQWFSSYNMSSYL